MNTPDNLYHSNTTVREFFRDIANMTDTFRSLTCGAFKGIIIREADSDWYTDVSCIGGLMWEYLERDSDTTLDVSIDCALCMVDVGTIDEIPHSALDYFVVSIHYNYPPIAVEEMYKTLFAKYGFRIAGVEKSGSTLLELRVQR